jgi:hypothetical protein
VLPFGRLWYGGPDAVGNAIGYAQHYSRSHDALIRVYDAADRAAGTTLVKPYRLGRFSDDIIEARVATQVIPNRIQL